MASESSPKSPVLTIEDLTIPTAKQPQVNIDLEPQLQVNLEREDKDFKQAFHKIVPYSLMISSMLIGTVAAVIVTVATLNPAVGRGLDVATGFGILAFVGGIYGLVQTIESYKSNIHKTSL